MPPVSFASPASDSLPPIQNFCSTAPVQTQHSFHPKSTQQFQPSFLFDGPLPSQGQSQVGPTPQNFSAHAGMPPPAGMSLPACMLPPSHLPGKGPQQLQTQHPLEISRNQCNHALDPDEACWAFDYTNHEFTKYRHNTMYLWKGQVKFMGDSNITEWHGRYRWSPDDSLEVHFNGMGNGGSLHPVLLRRVGSHEWEGEDYMHRPITIRFRRTFLFCNRCKVWKP